jgi:hypothetical protein
MTPTARSPGSFRPRMRRPAIGAETHRRCTPVLRMGTCVVFVNVDRGVAFQQARVNVDAWNGAEG